MSPQRPDWIGTLAALTCRTPEYVAQRLALEAAHDPQQTTKEAA